MSGRNVTTAFKNEIDNDVIYPRFFIDADFTAGTVYLWNGIGEIDWNGNTYSGVGDVLQIASVTESTEIKTANITIVFSALKSEYKNLALANVELSNDVTIRLALIDSSGSIIADPEIIFKGKMDEVNIMENGDSASFELIVNSRLVELERTKERRYTNQDQQQYQSGDTGLRHMVNTEKVIYWGDKLP